MSTISPGTKAHHNPEGATLHPHPERWSRALGCVLCMTTKVEMRSHAYELWCVPCLEKAAGHIARIATEARAQRKLMRLPQEELKKRRNQSRHAMRKLRTVIGERDNWTCHECGKFCDDDAHIDHIRPIVFGGTEDPENLQVLCSKCNSHKGPRASPRTSQIQAQAMANSKTGSFIFNPRNKDWTYSRQSQQKRVKGRT